MNLSISIAIVAGVAVLMIMAVATRYGLRRRKRRDYPAKVHSKWLDVQRLCSKKETWAQAVMNADKLLEDALKITRYKGKSIGERLVAAQRKLTDNDGVWYAHNLAKKLKKDNNNRMRESEVKKALIGFRQALRDLGVLNGK